MTTHAVRIRLHIDPWLFGATLALVVIGLWMVFDSSFVKTLDSAKMGHDAFFFLKRQAAGGLVGMAALGLMMRIGYWRLRDMAAALMILGVVLLFAVYLPHVGLRQNGASRWLNLGPLKFQPSEFAKLVLIIYLAKVLTRAECRPRLGKGLAAPLLVMALYLALIEREPDLGTAVVLFLAVLTVLWVAGVRFRVILALLVTALLLFAIFGLAFGHRGHRIGTWIHPGRDIEGFGFQVFHSRLAVGSGGPFGVGLGQGREKYYLPQGNTDFIFATLAEELGFFGTVAVLALLCMVGWRGFVIAQRASDAFARNLATGIAALISWQALVNIAVATGTIPATGVPLPFISNGSSSLVFLLAGIGILINVAQHPEPPTTGKSRVSA